MDTTLSQVEQAARNPSAGSNSTKRAKALS